MKNFIDTNQLWSIVLAAGEGTRLARLTRELYGEDLPKQFAALAGSRSLLQETVSRLLPLVPASRSVVVVPEKYGRLAEAQLGAFEEIDVVRQPRNVGTGPGILLPLARIRAWAPDATVVITPSDHHFRCSGRLLDRLPVAAKAAAESQSGVCLVGVQAEGPATDLGWIVADDAKAVRQDGSQVARFVEKPGPGLAADLHTQGGIWNTFVMVANVGALWRLARKHMPEQTALFDEYVASMGKKSEEATLHRAYESMKAADFSRDVLAHAKGLAVVSVENSGWSDLGTPERLMETLAGTPELALLKQRMSARPASSAFFDHLRTRAAV